MRPRASNSNGNKNCLKCGAELIIAVNWLASLKRKRYYICKSCHYERLSKWRHENPEKHVARNMRYHWKLIARGGAPVNPRDAPPKCCHCGVSLDGKNLMPSDKLENHHICRTCHQKYARERRIVNGLSRNEVIIMWEKQGRRCAICNNSVSFSSSFFDHSHVTKTNRGILCLQCNLGLGHFRDSTHLLQRAIYYLENASKIIGDNHEKDAT